MKVADWTRSKNRTPSKHRKTHAMHNAIMCIFWKSKFCCEICTLNQEQECASLPNTEKHISCIRQLCEFLKIEVLLWNLQIEPGARSCIPSKHIKTHIMHNAIMCIFWKKTAFWGAVLVLFFEWFPFQNYFKKIK